MKHLKCFNKFHVFKKRIFGGAAAGFLCIGKKERSFHKVAYWNMHLN